MPFFALIVKRSEENAFFSNCGIFRHSNSIVFLFLLFHALFKKRQVLNSRPFYSKLFWIFFHKTPSSTSFIGTSFIGIWSGNVQMSSIDCHFSIFASIAQSIVDWLYRFTQVSHTFLFLFAQCVFFQLKVFVIFQLFVF